MKVAGTTVEYTHEGSQYADRVYIAGPTTEKLKLMVGIKYSDMLQVKGLFKVDIARPTTERILTTYGGV